MNPPQVQHAVAYFNATQVGSIVHYYCHRGYRLEGLNPISCLVRPFAQTVETSSHPFIISNLDKLNVVTTDSSL